VSPNWLQGRTWRGLDVRCAIGIVVLVALLLRLGAVAATQGFVPGTDAADYDRQAVSVAAGHGYPPTAIAGGGGASAFRPPGYTYALAGVYAVVGTDSESTRWTAGRAMGAVAGAATVGLIGLLALALWGAAPAVVAAGLAAVYPPFLLMESSLTSEVLFLALVLASLLAIVHHRHSRRLRWAIAAGALAGLAALTRSNGVLLLIPIVLAAWTAGQTRSRCAVAAVAALAAAIVLVAPWATRNALELNAFVPISTQAGYGLAGAYNDAAREDPVHPTAWRPPATDPSYRAIIEDPGLGEAQVDRRLRAEASDFILDHPGYVAKTAFDNSLRLLVLQDPELERTGASDLGMNPTLAEASSYSFYAVALLALAGLTAPAARRTPLFVWLTPALLLLSTVFIAAWTRYRIPADPFIVLLAALGVLQLAAAVKRRRARGPATPRTTP
jgi:hypothetical protein